MKVFLLKFYLPYCKLEAICDINKWGLKGGFMSTNGNENNIFDASIKKLIDCYLDQLKESWINKQAIDGCESLDEFDSYNGFEFIDKNKELKEAFSSVGKSTNNGEFIDDCVVYYYTDSFSEFNYLNACLFLSITYYLRSKYLLDNNKDRNDVLMNIFKAMNNIGKFSGANEFKMLNSEYFSYFEEIKESASKGGNKRDERYMPTRQKVIELIKNEKPKGGWKDDKEFIKCMGDKIKKFNRDNGNIMSETSILSTVKKWLNHHEMVAPVFLENSVSGLTPD